MDWTLMTFTGARRPMSTRSSRARKPADLPMEQPMKFEFVVNLKTAKQIGVNDAAAMCWRGRIG